MRSTAHNHKEVVTLGQKKWGNVKAGEGGCVLEVESFLWALIRLAVNCVSGDLRL